MSHLKFVFYWSNERGKYKSFFSRRGSLDKDLLILQRNEIPVPSIVGYEGRGGLILIRYIGNDNQLVETFILSNSANKICKALGRILSENWATSHREQLKHEGDREKFFVETCPLCSATINLSSFPKTMQVYCGFCSTTSSFGKEDFEEREILKPDKGFSVCEVCCMFAKPRQFTAFYIIFFMWFKFEYYWKCLPCTRKDAWKMLFGNLIFVLGVPFALLQLFRSYGGTSIGGKYAGLHRANVLARKGHLEEAIESYRQILQKHPIASGVKYNIAQAFITQDRFEEATEMFEFALKDCANYSPAAQALVLCYERLGESEKMNELKRIWSVNDKEQDISPV